MFKRHGFAIILSAFVFYLLATGSMKKYVKLGTKNV